MKPTAQSTVTSLQRDLNQSKRTAVPQILEIIKNTARRTAFTDLKDLSEILGRDLSIAEQIVSAANSIAFNPTQAEVSSIHDAIHLVGLEHVKTLSLSALLASEAENRTAHYEQRENAALAICAGMLSQRIMDERGSYDPKQAFLCGAMRNYGRLLLACFRIDDYRKARNLALDLGEDAAFIETFGLTQLELSKAMLENSSVPKNVIATMRTVLPKDLSQESFDMESQFVAITAMATEVSEIAFDEAVDPHEFEEAIAAISKKLGETLLIDARELGDYLKDISEDLNRFHANIGDDVSSPGTQKLNARINGEILPPRPPEAVARRLGEGQRPQRRRDLCDAGKKAFAAKTFKTAVSVIKEEKNKADPKIDLIFKTAADAVMKGLDLDSCMILMLENPGKRVPIMSPRFGFGPIFETYRNKPIVTGSRKDLLTICLDSGKTEDVLIDDFGANYRISKIVPEWVTTVSKTTSFCILPVKNQDRIFAFIFGAVSDNRKLEINREDILHLKQLREQMTFIQERIERGSFEELLMSFCNG